VILGYHTDKDGIVFSLVLGTAPEGKLVYAGSVTPKLEGKDLSGFTKALAAVRTDRPFLEMQSDATWVRPRFSWRVSDTQQDVKGRLDSAQCGWSCWGRRGRKAAITTRLWARRFGPSGASLSRHPSCYRWERRG
jgi:hypothetical protein